MTAKRLLDISVSLAGLLVLSPFLLLTMAAIRLDSRGPIFFRQVRVGRDGVNFRIHKLRTMKTTQPPGSPEITVGRDPRITRVGSVLRKYKIDEAVQLIDVLAGDMSLVGPRPEVPNFVKHYPDHLRAKVLSVRPGITDTSSLKFFNESQLLENSRNPEKEYIENIIPEKLRMYCEYIDNQSFRGDLAILLATLRRVISK